MQRAQQQLVCHHADIAKVFSSLSAHCCCHNCNHPRHSPIWQWNFLFWDMVSDAPHPVKKARIESDLDTNMQNNGGRIMQAESWCAERRTVCKVASINFHDWHQLLTIGKFESSADLGSIGWVKIHPALAKKLMCHRLAMECVPNLLEAFSFIAVGNSTQRSWKQKNLAQKRFRCERQEPKNSCNKDAMQFRWFPVVVIDLNPLFCVDPHLDLHLGGCIKNTQVELCELENPLDSQSLVLSKGFLTELLALLMPCFCLWNVSRQVIEQGGGMLWKRVVELSHCCWCIFVSVHCAVKNQTNMCTSIPFNTLWLTHWHQSGSLIGISHTLQLVCTHPSNGFSKDAEIRVPITWAGAIAWSTLNAFSHVSSNTILTTNGVTWVGCLWHRKSKTLDVIHWAKWQRHCCRCHLKKMLNIIWWSNAMQHSSHCWNVHHNENSLPMWSSQLAFALSVLPEEKCSTVQWIPCDAPDSDRKERNGTKERLASLAIGCKSPGKWCKILVKTPTTCFKPWGDWLLPAHEKKI